MSETPEDKKNESVVLSPEDQKRMEEVMRVAEYSRLIKQMFGTSAPNRLQIKVIDCILDMQSMSEVGNGPMRKECKGLVPSWVKKGHTP